MRSAKSRQTNVKVQLERLQIPIGNRNGESFQTVRPYFAIQSNTFRKNLTGETLTNAKSGLKSLK